MATNKSSAGKIAANPVQSTNGLSTDTLSADTLSADTLSAGGSSTATLSAGGHGQPSGELPQGGDAHAIYRVASTAATLALAALLVGGVAMALTSRPGTPMAGILAAIADNPWPFAVAGVGLTLVSLFDIFTIPALHLALGRSGRVLVTLASVTAIVGDLLGIVGRLAQTAVVPLGLQAGTPARANIVAGDGAGDTGLLAAGQVLDVLDTTINTAGFVLVSVSFTCFGLLMMRGFSRRLGCIAIVAGLFTLLGQIPALGPLFLVANVAYIAWYVGIARRFWSAAHVRMPPVVGKGSR